MATVFTQMQGNQVGTGGFRHQRSFYRAGIAGAARLAQGGNVVDIHTKQNHLQLLLAGLNQQWR
jgi:hypothetical protein